MIKLTHLNRKEFHVNSDMIQYIETTPDTLIVLSNGDRIMVVEPPEEVVRRFVLYKQRLLATGPEHPDPPACLTDSPSAQEGG